jgi:hypothetical protein
MPRPHAEYDDDRPSPKSSNTVLWVILGVGGGVLLLVVLVCGGIIFLGYSSVKKVQGVVEDMQAAQVAAVLFVDRLGTGEVDAAYDSASAGFKSRQTKDQFEKFVSSHRGFADHNSRTPNNFNLGTGKGGQQYTTQFSLTGPNGNLTCTLILVVENGTWVVDSITVP